MSTGSIIALIVLAAVAGIICFNVGASLLWAGRRLRNWRLDGYRAQPLRIRENAGGILLTLILIVLILLPYWSS